MLMKELLIQDKGGNINNPETQRFLGELHNDKAFKEAYLVAKLFNYKQTQVFKPQGKLRLLVLKDKYDCRNPC